MGNCYYTSVGSAISTCFWGRDRRGQFPRPNLRPLLASLSFRLFLPKSRAVPADALSNRMPVRRSLFSIFSFNKNKAFPRGRSSKGRSITLMGLEPAIVSERPYDQSG